MTQKLHDTIRRLEQERDALAAQVGVLTTCLLLVKARHYGPLYDGADAAIGACMDDIPAAAARYLAAMRACELIDKDQRAGRIPAFDLGDSDAAHGLNQWRKACEGGGV